MTKPLLKKRKRRTDPLESTIESKVCKYAEAQGICQFKFTSPARRSVPDRIFLPGSGECFFIEFKRKGGAPTSGQEREIARLKGRGYRVYVVDSVEQGKTVIDDETVRRAL